MNRRAPIRSVLAERRMFAHGGPAYTSAQARRYFGANPYHLADLGLGHAKGIFGNTPPPGAIAANQDMYRPRYDGSDDFGGFDDVGFTGPGAGSAEEDYGGSPGAGRGLGSGGGFSGGFGGLGPDPAPAPGGGGVLGAQGIPSILDAGMMSRGVGKAASIIGFVPGPIGWAGMGVSAIAGLAELGQINDALADMHGKMGLQSAVPSITIPQAIAVGLDPTKDLQDLAAPFEAAMQAENAVNEAVTAAAATPPADETFGQGIDPGEEGTDFGGQFGLGFGPGSTLGWGSQEGYGSAEGGVGGDPGVGGGEEGGIGGGGVGGGDDTGSPGGGDAGEGAPGEGEFAHGGPVMPGLGFRPFAHGGPVMPGLGFRPLHYQNGTGPDPIRSVLAERRMFVNGGLLATDQGQNKANGILASSESLIDAVVRDAMSPQGGHTLSMTGGAMPMSHGGVVKPPTVSELFGPAGGDLSAPHLGPQGGTSNRYGREMRSDLDIRQVPPGINTQQIPTLTPTRSITFGGNLEAIYDPENPITMDFGEILRETGAETAARIYAEYGRPSFDEQYPEFKAGAEKGEPSARAYEWTARALSGGRDFVSEVSGPIAKTVGAVYDSLFSGQAQTQGGVLNARMVAGMIDARPDLKQDTLEMAKIIVKETPEIGPEALRDAIAREVSKKHEVGPNMGYLLIAEDVNIDPNDPDYIRALTTGVPDQDTFGGDEALYQQQVSAEAEKMMKDNRNSIKKTGGNYLDAYRR